MDKIDVKAKLSLSLAFRVNHEIYNENPATLKLLLTS